MNEFSVKNDLFCSGVYAIRCKQTGKCYIGSSENIKSRITIHKRLLAAGKHHNPGLQKDYNRLYDFDIYVIQKTDNYINRQILYCLEYACMIELSKDIELYNYEIEQATKDPEQFYINSILNNLKKINDLEFNCYYFNYISSKQDQKEDF